MWVSFVASLCCFLALHEWSILVVGESASVKRVGEYLGEGDMRSVSADFVCVKLWANTIRFTEATLTLATDASFGGVREGLVCFSGGDSMLCLLTEMCHCSFSTSQLAMLTECIQSSRLVTRTKESNISASSRVMKLACIMKVIRWESLLKRRCTIDQSWNFWIDLSWSYLEH